MQAKQDFDETTRRMTILMRLSRIAGRYGIKGGSSLWRWYVKQFQDPEKGLKNDGPANDTGELEGFYDEKAMLRVTEKLEQEGILCSVQEVDENGTPQKGAMPHFVQQHQRKLIRKLLKLDDKARRNPKKHPVYVDRAMKLNLRAKIQANRMQQAADLTDGIPVVGKLLQDSADRKQSRCDPDPDTRYVIRTNSSKTARAEHIALKTMETEPLLKQNLGFYQPPEIVHIASSEKKVLEEQEITAAFMQEHPELPYGSEKQLNMDNLITYQMDIDRFLPQRDAMMEYKILHTARVTGNQVELTVPLKDRQQVEALTLVNGGVVNGVSEMKWRNKSRNRRERVMTIEPMDPSMTLDKTLINDICERLSENRIEFMVMSDGNGEYRGLSYDSKTSSRVCGIMSAVLQKKTDLSPGSSREKDRSAQMDSLQSKNRGKHENSGALDLEQYVQILSVNPEEKKRDLESRFPGFEQADMDLALEQV